MQGAESVGGHVGADIGGDRGTGYEHQRQYQSAGMTLQQVRKDLAPRRMGGLRFKVQRFLQLAAQNQPHGYDSDSDDERDTPAPGLHLTGVELPREAHTDRSRQRGGGSLAGQLPRSILSALALWRR